MKLRKPVSLSRRKLTPSEQVLAEEIIRAWVDPGINLQYHARRQDIVRLQMPTLGRALDNMARERDR